MLSVYKIKKEPVAPTASPVILKKKIEDLTDDEKPKYEEARKEQEAVRAKYDAKKAKCSRHVTLKTWYADCYLGFAGGHKSFGPTVRFYHKFKIAQLLYDFPPRPDRSSVVCSINTCIMILFKERLHITAMIQ